MGLKIFIDDWRKPSSEHSNGDTWILCTSYEDFEQVLKQIIEKKETISEISFDYILEDRNYDGADCFKLLARNIHDNKLPIPEKIYIHSEFPNCEKYFKSVAMSLSHRNDVDVDLIRVHENGTQTILKTWE